MATAKKLPSGAYRIQVYAGKDAAGKRQYISITRPTKKEAEFEALQFQIHHKEVSRDSSNMTLAEAMDKYISSKDGVLSPSTIRGYNIIRRSHLQHLMDIRLNRLTNHIIQEAINEEVKPHPDKSGKEKATSPKSARNVIGLLSAVLRQYHPGFDLNVSLPQREAVEQTILEPDQIQTLLRAVEGTKMDIPVLLAVWLCMRSSEITGLTWDCVDFERNTITVRRAKVQDKDNHWVEKNVTKNSSSTRTLNAPDYIMKKLTAAKKTAETEHVVEATGNCLYLRLKRILKKNNLPDIRFHDLRHTSASVMAMLNVPNLYAQKRGGWATPNTMRKVYQHTMDSKRSAVDAQIDSFFESLL